MKILHVQANQIHIRGARQGTTNRKHACAPAPAVSDKVPVGYGCNRPALQPNALWFFWPGRRVVHAMVSYTTKNVAWTGYFPVVKLRCVHSVWFRSYVTISGDVNLGWNLRVAVPSATSPCAWRGRYCLKGHIPSFLTSTHLHRCTIRNPVKKIEEKNVRISPDFPSFPRGNRKNRKTQKNYFLRPVI